jgi:N-methylhydantoinase A
MGGTTAKVSLIDDFKPQTSRVFEVDRSSRFQKGSGMPVRIPAIDMVEIGAGGGSIARVDRLRRILVGPESSGALPGPACYGRGGTEPTVTDAAVMLGRIDVTAFAGGRVPLYAALSRAALERLGANVPNQLNATEAAYAIAELVDEAMTNATRVHAAENGKTLSERTLIAFGGAAPLHVGRMADKLGIARIIVPVDAGVGSAIGFLLAPVSYEVTRSHYVRLKNFDPDGINILLTAMAKEAYDVVRQGAQNRPLQEIRTAFARYVGQGHEIPVLLPLRPLTPADAVTLRGSFEGAYMRYYGRLIESIDVEILTWALTVQTIAADFSPIPPAVARAATAVAHRREIFDVGQGGLIPFAVLRRSALGPGSTLAGPAIIVEDATSTVVGRGYDVEIAGDGSIVMTRRGTA